MLGALEHLQQHILAEDIDAHAGQGAPGALGLLFKALQAVIRPDVDNAEAVGLVGVDPAHGQGDLGLVLDVLADHGPIVHEVDVVPGQDQHMLLVLHLHKVQVAAHGVRGALLPAAIGAAGVGLQQTHAPGGPVQIPGLADADVIVEAAGLVLGQHGHIIDVAVDAVAQGKVDNPKLAAEMHRRLRPDFCQNAHAGAGAPGHDHCHCVCHSLCPRYETISQSPNLKIST